MTAFKKTNVNAFPKVGPKVTSDTLFWKRFRNPVLLKEFGNVSHIDFSPVEPYYCAITCAARVQVYHPITREVYRNFSRSKRAALGGVFRSEGRLVAVGSEEGAVRLFDIGTRKLLRVFNGHTGPVHRVQFTSDNGNIVSFSDDKSIALWDIATEAKLKEFKEHTDYVRTGCVSATSPDTFISGSYDHTVKLWDYRQEQSTFTVNHESPVESVLMFPSGGIFLSAGSTEIRIWDALAGGKLLGKVSQHHKTVTCLRFAQDGRRLLSGGLDRKVKVYDVASYQVVHTLEYPSAILTMAISPHDETLAVGMADGLVSLARYHADTEETTKPAKKKETSYHYKVRRDFRPKTGDEVYRETNPDQMSKHDHYLRKFQFTDALDSVLRPYVRNRTPEVTVSVMKELMRREALRTAIAGRDGKSLSQLIQFVVQYILHVHFMKTLLQVADVIIELYGDNVDLPPDIQKYLVKLQLLINREYKVQKDLMLLEGAIDLILSGASIRNNKSGAETKISEKLVPSENAMTNFVVSV